MAPGNGLSVDKSMLVEKYQEIATIDEQLDAASGSEQAGKRAVANSISAETQGSWEKVVNQVVNAFEKLEDPNVLVGAYTAINKNMKEKFGDQVDKFLTEVADSRKGDVATLSLEELETLTASRKTMVEEYKAIANILTMFQFDIDDVPVPKKRTGSRGPRGPRVFGRYAFSVDGKERTSSQNTLSSIANTVTKDLSWSTANLREFLVSNGFDIENPPETFEVTLPNGKVLSGVMLEESEEDAEEEEVQSEEAE